MLISGVVSITLTPMLCSRFLRVVHAKKGFAGFMDRAFDRLRAGYGWSLRLVLQHRLVDARGVRGRALRDRRDVRHRPQGIHPGHRQRFVERQPPGGPGHVVSTRWSATRSGSSTSIKQNPYVEAQMVNAGGGGGSGGRFNIQLTPRATRPLTRPADRAAAQGTARALPGIPRVRQRAGGAADRRLPGQQQLQPERPEPQLRRAVQVGAASWRRRSPSCPRSRTSRTTWS